MCIRDSEKGGKLPVPVNFLLDEFPSIGKLGDFKRSIAFTRSFGMQCQVLIPVSYTHLLAGQKRQLQAAAQRLGLLFFLQQVIKVCGRGLRLEVAVFVQQAVVVPVDTEATVQDVYKRQAAPRPERCGSAYRDPADVPTADAFAPAP